VFGAGTDDDPKPPLVGECDRDAIFGLLYLEKVLFLSSSAHACCTYDEELYSTRNEVILRVNLRKNR